MRVVDDSVQDVVIPDPSIENIARFEEVVIAEIQAIRHACDPCLRLIVVKPSDKCDSIFDVEFRVFPRILAVSVP